MARFGNLNPYDLHKRLINDYILKKPGDTKMLQRDTSKDRTDYDVIRDNHQFLWDDEEDETDSWEKQLAKRYYDKLFKEYCICDLSRYKDNKVSDDEADGCSKSWTQFFRLYCLGCHAMACGEGSRYRERAIHLWKSNVFGQFRT